VAVLDGSHADLATAQIACGVAEMCIVNTVPEDPEIRMCGAVVLEVGQQVVQDRRPHQSQVRGCRPQVKT
jgi:hypothetical protein